MKKCPYCGKEYTDDIERCLTDGELLEGGNWGMSSVPPVLETTLAAPSRFRDLSDRQMRIAEVVIICAITLGPSILTSTYVYFNSSYGGSGRSAFAWSMQLFREISALGLLWYVLTRRQKTFADLGLVWRPIDIPLSIGIRMAASLGYFAVYQGIWLVGFTSTSREATTVHVGNMLFGVSIPMVAMLFQFVNPFFEELVVRAYLMTEIKALTNSTSKAILASTLLQTSYHFYQGGAAAIALSAVFLVFSVYYAKTNRITPLILAHLYSDVGATLWYMLRQ